MSFSFDEFQEKADAALKVIADDLGKLRTGKASLQMLDGVKVEAYGMQVNLNEVAHLEAPNPQLLTIKPWDKGMIGAVEKAINMSGLNLNPNVSSDHIFINIPPLTGERRQEMVKLLEKRIEEGKVVIRNLRTDTRKNIDKQKGQPGVSEDDIKAEEEFLDAETEKYVGKIDVMAKAKEKELTTI